MKKKHLRLLKINSFLMFFLFYSLIVKGQNKKNYFLFSVGLNSVKFFDNSEFAYNPFINSNDKVSYESINLSLGIERNNKHRITIDAISTGIYYPYEVCNNCVKIGEVINRMFFQFNLKYGGKIFELNKHLLWINGGVTYRKGIENEFLGFPVWWEIHTYSNYLSDLGLTGGLEYNYLIYDFLNFNLNSNLNYYLLNATSEKQAQSENRNLNGPTKGFIYLGIGLQVKV